MYIYSYSYLSQEYFAIDKETLMVAIMSVCVYVMCEK